MKLLFSCVSFVVAGAVSILALTLAPMHAHAAEHPLAASVVEYLPVPEEGEWDTLAVSPDGSRVYIGDAWTRIVVIDTATDTVADTIELPDDGFIGGIAFAPDGRLFVNTEYAFTELDPDTHEVLHTIEVPWFWYEGPMVVSPDSQYIYVAAEWDIFVVSIAGGEIAFVDTTPGDDEITGLVPGNPGWEPDFHRARRIAVSPDGDRLYVVGEEIEYWPVITALQVIDGLSAGPTASLTLSLYEMPNPTEASSEPRIVLSEDGSLLFDCLGNVWRTSDMTVLRSVAMNDWSPFEPIMIARAPNGAYLYYQGWSGTYGGEDEPTYGGEGILVAGGADYELIDLDDFRANGLTGIDLPGASGWESGGAYNNHEIVITPDGTKLYIAAGGSGALVVTLSISEWSGVVVPDRGGDDGEFTVRIVGSFEPGTTAFLSRPRADRILGTDTTVTPEGNLETTFDLTAQPLGAYDVVITFPDDSTWQIDEGFTIEEARLSAAIDMMGQSRVSVTDDAPVSIRCQNTGNVYLSDLVVSLRLPAGTPYKLDLPAAVEGGESQIDSDHTTADADVPEYIWIAELAPGESYRFWIDISGPVDIPPIDWNIQLEATVGFVKAPDDGAAKDRDRQSAIGDLCTIADALVKNIDRELQRRGHDVPPDQIEDVSSTVISNTIRDFGVAKLSGMVAKAIGELAVRALVPEAMPLWDVVFGTVSDIKSCLDLLKTLMGFDALFSWDPNDKISSTGVEGYILGPETLYYVIHFENLPEATAPAHTVTITDQLDDNLDYATFALGDSSHGDLLSADLDEATGLLSFTFTGIDLPPNVNPPEGEGWVEFSIRPLAGLPSGTRIGNQASIVFDTNEPIVTPEVIHTVDTDPPTSTMTPLAETTEEPTFTVEWSGQDDGVGVWDYTIYVSVNGGEYNAWLTDTPDTSADYSGSVGNEYRFYGVARDRLGNVQPTPGQAGAETTVVTEDGMPEPDGDLPRGCGGGGCGAVGVITWPLMFLGLRSMRRRVAGAAFASGPRGE